MIDHRALVAGLVGAALVLGGVGLERELSSSSSDAGALELVLPHVTGRLNPDVTPATIAATICVRGWTATVRPPVSYTSRIKRGDLILYGLPGPASDYELDHLIPLELGGAPRDPQNLWPEPHSQSAVSDPLENELRRRVCAGELTLARARAAIRRYKLAHG